MLQWFYLPGEFAVASVVLLIQGKVQCNACNYQ